MDPARPPAVDRLRLPLLRLADALNAAHVDPATADALFTDRPLEDTHGRPIEGFERARWERLDTRRREAAWALHDESGRLIARLRLIARPARWRVELFEM